MYVLQRHIGYCFVKIKHMTFVINIGVLNWLNWLCCLVMSLDFSGVIYVIMVYYVIMTFHLAHRAWVSLVRW